MIFLPIVQRELRVAARRRGVYLSRLGCALAAMGVGSWIMLLSREQDQQSLGPALFVSLAVIIFIYTVTGVLNCDCLSVEKREGTLGLLFLTDLRGYDVVLGKLAATSVNAFYGMLAVMPILAIPILLGAVGVGEFCRVALVAVNLMFFFLCVGVFASAVCRQDSRGLGLSAAVALLLMVGAPWLIYYLTYRLTRQAAGVVWTISPAFDCFLAFDDPSRSGRPTFQNHPGWFWGSLTLTQCYSWLFLMAACFIVPRSWHDRSSSQRDWRGGWQRFLKMSPQRRAIQRRKLLEINPFLWRVARGPFKQTSVWLFFLLVGGAWILARRGFLTGFDSEEVFWLLFLHIALKCWVALDACRPFADDRRSGSLELLLSTPLTEAQIIHGQFLALWRKFGPPVIVVLLLDAIFLGVTLRQPGSDEDYRVWIGVYLTSAVFLALDLIALSWMSMWLGLSGRKPNRAAMASFSAIVLLPSVFFWVAAPVVNILFRPEMSAGELVVAWGVVGLAADAFFALTSREKLMANFRGVLSGELATVGSGAAGRPAIPRPLANPQPASERG